MSCSAIRKLDLLGYGETWIHRRDSRAKLVAAFVFLACVASFPKYEVSALIPFFIVPVLWGRLGEVPPGPVFRILLMAAPFAVLLGAFNPILDREPFVLRHGLVLSGGWISFSSIIIRFLLSVGIVLVLVATSSMPRIFNGMLHLGLPRVFILQLQFLYRYLFVLIDEGQDLNNARRLRDPDHALPPVHLVSRILSTLLFRSLDRARRIYLCMCARGFEGEVPVLSREKFKCVDICFIALIMVFCLSARFLPVTVWIGSEIRGVAGF